MDSGEREKKLLEIIDDTYSSLELVLRHVDETLKLAQNGEIAQCLNNLSALQHSLTFMLDGHSISDGMLPAVSLMNQDKVGEAKHGIVPNSEPGSIH